MRSWIIAVIVGLVTLLLLNLLILYIASLEAGADSVWIGYALSALIFLAYFLLGVFLALLGNLRATGAAFRVRWAEFALGAFLLLVSIAIKLEQAAGLISAIGSVGNNAVLTAIVAFDYGLYLWVVLAGFFLKDAFARVPAAAAQAVPAAAASTSAGTQAANAKNARLTSTGTQAANPKSARLTSTGTRIAAANAAAGPKSARLKSTGTKIPGA